MRPHVSLNCSLFLRATAVAVTLCGFGVGHGAAQETVAEYTIELVERDHGYNPQRSVQAYNEIQDRSAQRRTVRNWTRIAPCPPRLRPRMASW